MNNGFSKKKSNFKVYSSMASIVQLNCFFSEYDEVHGINETSILFVILSKLQIIVVSGGIAGSVEFVEFVLLASNYSSVSSDSSD